jgi:hypothetical protein
MTDSIKQDFSDEPGKPEHVQGRSVFLVETTPAGVAVQTALLTESGKLLNMPAIFPDVQYAFEQIDELKRLVSHHFSQAAQLGAQIMAEEKSSSKH